MEVAGFGDDAFGARVTARVPARMRFFAWRERALDVVGGGKGQGRLRIVGRGAPGARVWALNLVGIGDRNAHAVSVFVEEKQPIAAIL
jgi:hypothetical protein